MVRELLDQNINLVNQINGRGETPLALALHNEDLPMIAVLIEYGAEVNYFNEEDNQWLFNEAVKTGRIDIVSRLLEAGAQILEDDYSSLERAVNYGLAKMTAFLINQGADPFYTDDDNNTLLHLVCSHDYISDPRVPESNYADTLQILLEYRDPNGQQLDIDARNYLNATPLAVASEHNIDLVKILLDYGANSNLVDWNQLNVDSEIRDLIHSYNIPEIKEPVDY